MIGYKNILLNKIDYLKPIHKTRNWMKYLSQVNNLTIESFDQLCWDYRMNPCDMLNPTCRRKVLIPYKTRDLVVAKRECIESHIRTVKPFILPIERIEWLQILTRRQLDLFMGKRRRGSMETTEGLSCNLGMLVWDFLNPYNFEIGTLERKLKEIKNGNV